jgi:hypothetical protein
MKMASIADPYGEHGVRGLSGSSGFSGFALFPQKAGDCLIEDSNVPKEGR